MERAVPTYYPGDRVVLSVEIEHRANFRWVEVGFLASSARVEDTLFREHRAVMRTVDVVTQETVRTERSVA